MRTLTQAEVGWLAGFLDGEGSVGITRTNSRSLSPQVQVSITCESTHKYLCDLMEKTGISCFAQSYREKVPERHRPSWYFRVGRLNDVLTLARIVGPHSVTKREHWLIIERFCSQRVHGRRVDSLGRMHSRRAGPYTGEQVEMFDRLRRLNKRGPRDAS